MTTGKLIIPETSGVNGRGRNLTATDIQLVSLYTDLRRSDIDHIRSVAGIYDVTQMRGLLKCRLNQMEKRRSYLGECRCVFLKMKLRRMRTIRPIQTIYNLELFSEVGSAFIHSQDTWTCIVIPFSRGILKLQNLPHFGGKRTVSYLQSTEIKEFNRALSQS